MKLIKCSDDVRQVWVQICDIVFLLSDSSISVPRSLVEHFEAQVREQFDDYAFVEFDDEESVRFLVEQELILNYSDYKDLNKSQMFDKIDETVRECDESSDRDKVKYRFIVQQLIYIFMVNNNAIKLDILEV